MADGAPDLNGLDEPAETPAYERVLFHGTEAGRQIREQGLKLGRQTGMIYATSYEREAREGYGSHGETFTVRVRLRNPLILDVAIARSTLVSMGVSTDPSNAGQRAMAERLRELGYDGLVISYPEDARDPSDYYPAREIVRVFDEAAVTIEPEHEIER